MGSRSCQWGWISSHNELQNALAWSSNSTTIILHSGECTHILDDAYHSSCPQSHAEARVAHSTPQRRQGFGLTVERNLLRHPRSCSNGANRADSTTMQTCSIAHPPSLRDAGAAYKHQGAYKNQRTLIATTWRLIAGAAVQSERIASRNGRMTRLIDYIREVSPDGRISRGRNAVLWRVNACTTLRMSPTMLMEGL